MENEIGDKMENVIFGKFILLVIIGVAVLLLIPLPVMALDILIIINLIISLIILLMALNMKKVVEFSIFPRILLLTTLFQLALNIASTRLILTKGAGFDGRLIRAIADFVSGSGNTGILAVWFSLFIIITVSIMVIVKGSVRVSEVAAIARKDAIQRESDFFASMNGAVKFISGTMKMGIVIIPVNILGGIIIGTTLNGEPMIEAVETYISLAIGAGLLFQFPALLISIPAGIFAYRMAVK
jgi:flagellar biosynthesis protein FlhA